MVPVTVLRSGDFARVIQGDYDRTVPASDIHSFFRNGTRVIRVYESGTLNKEIIVPPGDGDVNDPDGVLTKNVTKSVALTTDNPTGDAFGRLRVSEPQALHDGKNIFGDDTKYWSSTVGGTFGNGSAVAIGTTGGILLNTADMTALAGDKEPEWRVGLATRFTDGMPDSGMGMGLDVANGRFFWIRRNAGDETIIPSSQWNVDAFDGTGPSGIAIDWSKPQIFDMDFEWLGVGRIRFGFNIDGKTYYAHQENVANNYSVNQTPYLPNPNMRVFYFVKNTDVTTGDDSWVVRATRQCFPYQAGRSQRLFLTGIFGEYTSESPQPNLTQVCSSVHSESGSTFLGGRRMLRRTAAAAGVSTGFVSVLAARIDADKPGTIVNYFGGGVFTGDNVTFEYAICLNPTVAAGAENWGAVPGSNLQQSIDINNAVTDLGLVIGGGFASSTAQNRQFGLEEYASALKLGHASNNANTPDEIHVVVRTLGGSAAFWAHIDLEEGY